MAAPPGLLARNRSGGSWNTSKAKRRDMAITAAHTVLINCGIEMSASKVARLVQRFDNRAAHHGWSLFDYIATHVAISAEQRYKPSMTPTLKRSSLTGTRPARLRSIG